MPSPWSDADGLGSFSYQWLRNGSSIGGATASTYTLDDADVGANISVQVSWTDGQGTAESLTSATVGPVASVNDVPTGVPTISGTATEDQTLTAVTAGIADADGIGAFSYQWLRNGSSIAGATASTYNLGDADVGAAVSVRVGWTDGQGTAELLTSAATAAVTNINDAPTGAPIISGTPTEDQTLSVATTSIADDDGLGSLSLQWLRGWHRHQWRHIVQLHLDRQRRGRAHQRAGQLHRRTRRGRDPHECKRRPGGQRQ